MSLALYARIQEYLRFAASHGRETEQIGPFLATFTPENPNPYTNYAIPADNAVPTAAEVAALAAAFRKRARKPRLEYVADLAPAVEAALAAAGFVAESRTPLMTCPRETAPLLPVPPGIEFLVPISDADLLATVTAQSEAYNGDPPSAGDVERLRNSIAAGSIVVLARDAVTKEAAGGGVCTVPGSRTTEVAGIGVRTAFRRRGIAAALTSRLVREAFAVGVELPFLMAAGEDEARIYGRAGFVRIGDVLHISLP